MDWITANAHHLLLGLLLVIGLAIAITAVVFIRHARDPLRPVAGPEKEKSDWLTGTAFVIAIVIGNAWLDNRDARIAAEVDAARALVSAGYFAPERATLTVNLNDCPPQRDGMTDQVIMVIATQPDGKHTQRGCSRIAHRQYEVRKLREGVRG